MFGCSSEMLSLFPEPPILQTTINRVGDNFHFFICSTLPEFDFDRDHPKTSATESGLRNVTNSEMFYFYPCFDCGNDILLYCNDVNRVFVVGSL